MINELKNLDVGSFININIKGLSKGDLIIFHNLICNGYLIPTDLSKYKDNMVRIQLGEILVPQCKYYVNMKITDDALNRSNV